MLNHVTRWLIMSRLAQWLAGMGCALKRAQVDYVFGQEGGDVE